jgi:hypothetical protein
MWFKFDTGLVIMMVVETWVTSLLMGGASTGLPTGMIKLLRLLRLARMARLMRVCPELMAMIKGVRVASRAVGSALLMLVILVYIFAIIMHMLLKDASHPEADNMAKPEIGNGVKLINYRFRTIPLVMWTLVVDATFLDGIGICSRALLDADQYTAFLVLVVFVLASAMTVMNMLIGVLCEVVTAVAAAEKEDAAIRLVKETVLVMLTALDEDGSGEISKDEINTVFGDESALLVLDSLKVDVRHLVDHLDMYYEEQDDLTIPQIMDLILMLRGDRNPTMKDMLHEQTFNRWKLTSSLKGKLSLGDEEEEDDEGRAPSNSAEKRLPSFFH